MTRIAVLASVLALTSCLAEPDDPELATVDDAVVLAGHQVVVAETAVDTLGPKQLIVACPAGTRALGAGWAALDRTGAYLNGKATYSAPSFDGASWMINASNTSSWQPSWKLRVRVTCARVDGYEIRTVEAPVVAFSATRQIRTACPPGKRATGAGFAAVDPTGAILAGEATYFLPSFDGTGWLANLRGPLTPWTARGVIVCASATSLSGYVPVTTTSPASTTPKQAITTCPGAKIATGAGWAVLDGTDAILAGTALASLPGLNGRSWTTNAQGSAVTPWKLRTTTLCVD